MLSRKVTSIVPALGGGQFVEEIWSNGKSDSLKSYKLDPSGNVVPDSEKVQDRNQDVAGFPNATALNRRSWREVPR
jgi:hypothetical protein